MNAIVFLFSCLRVVLEKHWCLFIFQTNWSSSTNSEVELFRDIGLLTLDIILKCAFSYQSDCQVKR